MRVTQAAFDGHSYTPWTGLLKEWMEFSPCGCPLHAKDPVVQQSISVESQPPSDCAELPQIQSTVPFSWVSYSTYYTPDPTKLNGVALVASSRKYTSLVLIHDPYSFAYRTHDRNPSPPAPFHLDASLKSSSCLLGYRFYSSSNILTQLSYFSCFLVICCSQPKYGKIQLYFIYDQFLHVIHSATTSPHTRRIPNSYRHLSQ